ncbi:hypothetical protein GBA52_020511 [Prunus armeniaca]|nr:hypothetical protein GBA52_020511 [Prunus armeniaca]
MVVSNGFKTNRDTIMVVSIRSSCRSVELQSSALNHGAKRGSSNLRRNCDGAKVAGCGVVASTLEYNS